MFISIGKVGKILGVSVSSLRNWDKSGILCPAFRTNGNHRRYKYSEVMEMAGELDESSKIAFGYARVSGNKQKKDLENQMKSIKEEASNHNLQLQKVYSDIASGINDERKNLIRMLTNLCIVRPKKLIVTYRDRLSRFGTNVIELFCRYFGTELVFIHQKQEVSLEQELAEGVIEVITSYAGKFHRRRRGHIV